MGFFPINLALSGRPVVVIGGGAVAARKCAALSEAGAGITVIAPHLHDRLREMHEQGLLIHVAREFRAGDIADAFLVFAATDNPMVNAAVAEEARSRGILANIADAPEIGTFTLPAVAKRGDLLIAVSTGGKSPALARRLREELEDLYGPEYAVIVELLGKVREKLLTEKGNSAYNKKLLNELVCHDLAALLRNRSTTEIDHLLTKLFGPGYTLAGLGVGEKDTA